MRSQIQTVHQAIERTRYTVKALRVMCLEVPREHMHGTDSGEVLANLTLALRHIEDAEARMQRALDLSPVTAPVLGHSQFRDAWDATPAS